MNWSSASSPWCQWPPVMRNSRSMSAGSSSSEATTWRRRPGAWRSSTPSARSSSSRRAASPFARSSNGAYSTTAESTCLPGGASDLSASDGIVISSAGSGEHCAVLRGVEGVLEVSEVRRDHQALAHELRRQPREGRQRLEREVQLRRHALVAEMAHAMHEAGLEMPGAQQAEQRARRVGVRDHRACGDLLAVLELDAGDAVALER